MGLSFAFVVGTGCIAGLLRHRTQGEMCYLCNGIALVCLMLALILAPFWIRVAILVAIVGERVFSASRTPLIFDPFYADSSLVEQSAVGFEKLSDLSDIASAPDLQYRGVSYTERLLENCEICPLPDLQCQYRGVSYRLAKEHTEGHQ